MGIGAHGGDYAAARGASSPRCARCGQDGIVVHGAKRLLTACGCDGGTERNDHVVHTGQGGNMGIRSQGCEIRGMQMQPWVCDVRRTPTLGMQGMHFGR
ncbi:hypothetical protein D3C87_1642540 [compost metagenome]